MYQCSLRGGIAAVWIFASTLPAGAETWLQRWVETQEALFVRETFDEVTAQLGFVPVQAGSEEIKAEAYGTDTTTDVTASIGTTRPGDNGGVRTSAKARRLPARGYQRCTGYSWCTTSCRRAAKGSRQALWCEQNGARTAG